MHRRANKRRAMQAAARERKCHLGDVPGEALPPLFLPVYWPRRQRLGVVERGVRSVVTTLATVVIGVLVLCWLVTTFVVVGNIKAHGRDIEGRYIQSQYHDWFNSLKNRNGRLCCSIADGRAIQDVDWDIKDGRYRVRIDGAWVEVPDEAIVGSHNRLGSAVVWPLKISGGRLIIRCFMPGSFS